MTPYEVVYENQPPFTSSYILGTSKVRAVDALLQNYESTLASLKDNLVMAQSHMQHQVDKNNSK